ncbi:MAG: PAS domain S-box protein [Chloroflexota bacterium]
MGKPLRALIIEDSEGDALLMVRELKRGDFDVTSERVDTAETMEAALDRQEWDIIIADYSMPHFNGLTALNLMKDKAVDLPFIIVSGSISDSMAVAAMKAGAHDYVMKDNLSRLVPAVERELREVAVRQRQRQAEARLRESEFKYRSLYETMIQGVVYMDEAGRIISANPAATRMLGLTLGQMRGYLQMNPRWKVIHEDGSDYPLEEQPGVIALRTGREVADVVMGVFDPEDKHLLWLNVNAVPQFLLGTNERAHRVCLTLTDITEQRRNRETLRENEERYRSVVENANEAISVLQNGRVKFVNTKWLEVMGYSWEEAADMPEEHYIHPDSLPAIRERQRRLQRGETVEDNFPYRVVTKSGDIRWVEAHIAQIIWNGQPARLILRTDITEKRQAEESIRRAAEEWRITFDSITDLVSIHSQGFKLVRVNKTFADILKVRPKELIGKTCCQVVHGTDQPISNCPHLKTLATGKPATAEFFEPRLGIYMEVTTSPVFNAKGEVTASVHVARDITERKKMEEQLAVTDRLASIGELASGVAHELNNPLTSVIGFSELLLAKDLPADIKEDLDIINREAQRTAQVVRNLLTFARKHPQEKEAVDINRIISEVLALRAYEQKVNDIKVETKFAPDLPSIHGNSFQLQQVFLNIIINAEYFMSAAHGRGQLAITTKPLKNIIRISFADDGPGISQETLAHVFDPFFTTKEVGRGTGLGLSICHGTITEHDGRIYVESEPGKGATFIIELPTIPPKQEGVTHG